MKVKQKIKLHGYNNITKTLCFNIYEIAYVDTAESEKVYNRRIADKYQAGKLTALLKNIADLIGARVLNVASQDYDPSGASVAMLVAEECCPGGFETLLHLDKSHITIHTYPENHPENGIYTIRADIDISTCGEISPLRALDSLMRAFPSHLVMIDYRIRGFARKEDGKKLFLDHSMETIQDFINPEILRQYEARDYNFKSQNLFLTKLKVKEIDWEKALFLSRPLAELEEREIFGRLDAELQEIFLG